MNTFFGKGGGEGGAAGQGGALLTVADKAGPNKSACPSLPLKTRLQGWAVCFGVGCAMSILSASLLGNIMKGHMTKFAVVYIIGTGCSLASSFFLWGPMN